MKKGRNKMRGQRHKWRNKGGKERKGQRKSEYSSNREYRNISQMEKKYTKEKGEEKRK